MKFERAAVNFENVTKYFGQHRVLDHLDFDIPRGKITTILGFSGAGKSTLLKHILGLLRPEQGRVSVLDQDLAHLGRSELRKFRRHFGMLFQHAALFDSRTAIENVCFPLREFTDLAEEEILHTAHDLLLKVDLPETSHQRLPSELSGGMRKRVGLARALALSPSIILYDEPTTGLDPITTRKVNQLICSTAEAYNDRQLTSIIISHDIRATLEVSDFIAFMEHGKIVEYLPASEFPNSRNELVREFVNL